MTLPLFPDNNYTLRRESPESYREFEESADGVTTGGWELMIPESADGIPYQFILVGPSADSRGTALRLSMLCKDGSPVPDDADVLLESYYHTGSERTVMFQGKYGEFRAIPDQDAADAAVSIQKRAEIGEQYVIRLSVSIATGSVASGSLPDPVSDDSYFELECVKLWWNESA